MSSRARGGGGAGGAVTPGATPPTHRRGSARPGPAALVAAAGVAELAFLGALGWWPGPGVPLPGLLLFACALSAWAVAAVAAGAWAAGAREIVPGTRAAGERGRRGGRGGSPGTLIWAFALLFRVVLLPLEPELSGDVYRYLWDGHVQLAGVNPYVHAPADPALDSLRTPWHGSINNPEVPTIYPPVAQLAFLFLAAVGGTVLQAKLLWLAFDLATGWLLARVAWVTGRSRRVVLILYLWSPLLVVETAWNAHLEPLGLFGLALLLALAHRPVAAGVSLGAAGLTKFAPLAALPPLARRHGTRFVAACLAFTALLYLPYLGAGSRLWAGLDTYARHWRFNPGLFSLVELVAPGPVASRAVVAVLVLGVVAWTTLRAYDPERALLWILGTGLLLTPTLHPWYALWILPLAALRRSVPWLLLTGLAFIGYLGLATYEQAGVWPQPPWSRFLLWGPPLLLLAAQGVRSVWGRRRGDPPPVAASGD